MALIADLLTSKPTFRDHLTCSDLEAVRVHYFSFTYSTWKKVDLLVHIAPELVVCFYLPIRLSWFYSPIVCTQYVQSWVWFLKSGHFVSENSHLQSVVYWDTFLHFPLGVGGWGLLRAQLCLVWTSSPVLMTPDPEHILWSGYSALLWRARIALLNPFSDLSLRIRHIWGFWLM